MNSKDKVCTKIGPSNIESSEQQKSLGVLTGNRLLITILMIYAQRLSKN